MIRVILHGTELLWIDELDRDMRGEDVEGANVNKKKRKRAFRALLSKQHERPNVAGIVPLVNF